MHLESLRPVADLSARLPRPRTDEQDLPALWSPPLDFVEPRQGRQVTAGCGQGVADLVTELLNWCRCVVEEDAARKPTLANTPFDLGKRDHVDGAASTKAPRVRPSTTPRVGAIPFR